MRERVACGLVVTALAVTLVFVGFSVGMPLAGAAVMLVFSPFLLALFMDDLKPENLSEKFITHGPIMLLALAATIGAIVLYYMVGALWSSLLAAGAIVCMYAFYAARSVMYERTAAWWDAARRRVPFMGAPEPNSKLP